MSNQTLWTICRVLAIVVLVLCVSPLVIAPGKVEPILAGTPYALWMGFLASIVLTILTWWGTRLQSSDSNESES